jgi:hypothetical protein
VRDINIKVTDSAVGVLSNAIVRCGENQAARMLIDVSSWEAIVGEDALYTLILRREDGVAWPVLTEASPEDGIVAYVLLAADTAVVGIAQWELRAVRGEMIAKSALWSTRVSGTIAAGDAPPELDTTWLDQITAQEAVRQAQEATRQTQETERVDAEAARAVFTAWNSETSYVVGNKVSDAGSSYVCIAANTNQQPPNEIYWLLIAARGGDITTAAELPTSDDSNVQAKLDDHATQLAAMATDMTELQNTGVDTTARADIADIATATTNNHIKIFNPRSKNYQITSGVITSLVFSDEGFVLIHPNTNATVRFYFVVEAGRKYKLHISLSTSIAYALRNGITNTTNMTTGTELSSGTFVSGENIIEFTSVDNACVLAMTMPYNSLTITATDTWLEPDGVVLSINPNAVLSVAQSNIKRTYESTNDYIYTSATGGDFYIYTNGFIDSSELDGSFTIGDLSVTNSKFPVKNVVDRIMVHITSSELLTLMIMDRYGLSDYINVTFRASTTPSNPATEKHILFMGDSLVASVTYPTEFINYLVAAGLTNYKLIGRMGGTNGIYYDGVGGYAWPNYVSDPATLPAEFPNNYFWNTSTNQLDIQNYFTTYCGGVAPDYIICNVGWNQFVNDKYKSISMDTIETLCTTFIDAVHSAYPNCKIILNGIHHGYPNLLNSIPHRAFAIALGRLYASIANSASYSSFVLFCDVAPYFDAKYGMQSSSRAYSNWTEETETYVSDIVHPNAQGYKMHAFADFQAFLYMTTVMA